MIYETTEMPDLLLNGAFAGTNRLGFYHNRRSRGRRRFSQPAALRRNWCWGVLALPAGLWLVRIFAHRPRWVDHRTRLPSCERRGARRAAARYSDRFFHDLQAGRWPEHDV